MSNNDSRTSRRASQDIPKQRRHWIKRTIKWLLVIFIVILCLGVGLFFYYAQSAPRITRSALESDTSTKVYDANNNVVSRLGAQNRDYVKSKNIPSTLKAAVVSIEDRRFYKNHGVDPVRIFGAAFSDITGSSLGLQGGSTLTQQLVKLSVFSTSNADRTLKRKAQEAWLAIKVEQKYSKQQILEFYINKVYMGNGVYGMQTAAKYYYGKSLRHLSLPQLALIAGLPQSPNSYDPNRHPQYAKYRRDLVLKAMAENKAITNTQDNHAKLTSIKTGLIKKHNVTSVNKKNSKVIDSYLKEVYSELKDDGYNTNTDGLRVYTNLNMAAQRHLYSIANSKKYVNYPNKSLQVGATLVNPKNGEVIAMLGGRKVGNVAFGLNRAVQTDRSSGSTIKPLMDYGPAIEYLKYPTYQTIQDTPYTYTGTNKRLHDFDNKYEGRITMRKALVESRNIPAIRTLEAVGLPKATRFLDRLGMKFKHRLGIQNGIGVYVSSEQEAAAYSAFANGGTYYKPHLVNRVVTADGNSHDYESSGSKAMSQATAFMITDMLKGVMNDSNGSGTAANIPGLYQAGKTGTTAYPSDFAKRVPIGSVMDSWMTGYTKNFSLSVWTGYDRQFSNGGYITQNQTKIAQEIYRSEMAYVQQNNSNENWKAPSDIVPIKRKGTVEYYIDGYPGDVSNDKSSDDIPSIFSQSSSSNSSSASSSNSSSASSSNSSSASSSNSDVTTTPRTQYSNSSQWESSYVDQEQKPNGGSNGNKDYGSTRDNSKNNKQYTSYNKSESVKY